MNKPFHSPAERAFYRQVVAHLKNFSNVIDVTRFANSQHWTIQKIMKLYLDVLWDNPEIFYVPKKVHSWREENSDGSMRFAKLIDIEYAFPQEELQQNKLRLDAEVQKAVRYAAGEASPEMIALRLHDYIVQTCEYDIAAADNDDFSPLARTVYSVLVRKKAVCEGYTMAYRYLLKKFNIKCEEIVSEKMQHCWNYVCINDNWYHVDVTYDDPILMYKDGRLVPETDLSVDRSISHKYFLMSDAKARKCGHHGWSTKGLPKASSSLFDHVDWE